MSSGRRTERQLLAILAADVVGYSALMGQDEAGTLTRLKRLRKEVFDPAVQEHNGRIVKLIGDGTLVTFQSVVDAVTCAVSIQRLLATLPDSTNSIHLRIGVNIGDVIIEGNDIYGDGVNIAARLEGICNTGGVVVSETVYEHVHHKLDFFFEALGEHQLKNISDPIRTYRIVFDGQPKSRRWPTLSRTKVAGLAVALAVSAVGAQQFWQRSRSPPEKPSILVLPFAGATNDPQHDIIADGIVADIITDLSKVSGLVVIARSSAFAFKNAPVDPAEAAKRLNVRYVLTGTVRLISGKLKVNVELVDSDTHSNIWADRFESRVDEFFKLQDNLVRSVVSSLSVRLTDSEMKDLSRLPTNNLEAYDFYTRAEQKAYATGLSSLREILQLYEKAISLDPNFSDAHAGYARAIVDVLGTDAQPLMLSAVARQRAYEAAGRALEINPRTPRAYSVLAILQLLDRQFDRALESARTAEQLDPHGADAKLNLAIVLTYAGFGAEALSVASELAKLDPTSRPQVVAYQAFVSHMNRRNADAVTLLESIPRSDLDDFALETLCAAYAGANRLEQAQETAKLLLERNPTENLASLAVIYAQHQHPEDLRYRLDLWRAAGIPEWPFGFRGSASDQLRADDIRSMTQGKTWRGELKGGARVYMQLDAGGTFAQRGLQGMIAGHFSIEGDKFCVRSSAVLLGRSFCSPIFRNSDATKPFGYAYADYVNVWYFDVVSVNP